MVVKMREGGDVLEVGLARLKERVKVLPIVH
jgi:hypothetical protein